MSLNQLETGPQVWEKLAKHFARQRLYLLGVRDEEGLQEAQLDHSQIVADMPSLEQLERMFMTAYWQYPEHAELIEETEMNLNELLSEIPTREEEQMDELRTIRIALMSKLRAVRHDIKVCLSAGVPFNLRLDYDDPNEIIRPFLHLSKNSEEARKLIEDIRVILDDFVHLVREHSKW